MRADRVVSMMLLLERRGRMTAAQLAEELGVSRRTVMRDVEALGIAGVPIYSTRGREGGFHIWEGFRSQLRGLTADEAGALALLGTPLVADRLGLGAATARVALKLEQALPPELANEMATVEARFHHDPDPWDGVAPEAALAFFEVAIRRRRIVRTRIDGSAETLLHPLAIILKAGEWFLIADTGLADGMYTAHPVAHLHGYGTTGDRFPYPEDFEARTWWTQNRTAVSPNGGELRSPK